MSAANTAPAPTPPAINVEEKLFQNRYRVDPGRSHICTNDPLVCSACAPKPCVVCCHAGAWRLEKGKVDIVADGCLECGSCRIVCDRDNVDWFVLRYVDAGEDSVGTEVSVPHGGTTLLGMKVDISVRGFE